MSKKFSFPEMGLEVEIGKFARQAHGAAWMKVGGNVVLSTAVASTDAKEFMGFFPLTVEYRERTSAAGKIPGGYIKREGKLSDNEVLASRVIDRSIRPLFPAFYFNEVQALSTVYSSDGSFPTEILGVLGTSIALLVSPIPFNEPVGAVQIGLINGEWKFNSGYAESSASDSRMTIVGTQSGICMVEGYCNNLSEEKLIDLLFLAHQKIQAQIEWQRHIQKELGIVKTESTSTINWKEWEQKVKAIVTDNSLESLFALSKTERSAALNTLEEQVHAHFAEEVKAGNVSKSVISYLCDAIISDSLPQIIAKKQVRLDDRKLNQVRPIVTEVKVLPCVHGSAMFQRGETQALASLTLGTAQDAQKVESLLGGMQERSFMLHYNMPPFATGEVKPMRGVGRREIGHGYLAETSFANVLPSAKDFPYTIRTVVDVLESNGSSSMATVCSTTMALMDAGVPITAMVGGVAMGMIKDAAGNFHVLTDILGSEDAYGLMDFKITGTEAGIMAFQLDIKYKIGFAREVFVKALQQAKEGRLHILGEMKKVMSKPNAEISELAPRIFSLQIPQDKIGALIGPGGKNIKEIVAKTETQIDIEDDGRVNIYSKTAEAAKQAELWIKTIVGDIEIGSTFSGIIRRFADFGIFVELVPGKEGLVHISSIARSLQRDLEDNYHLGDTLKVKVTDFDRETGRVRLVAPDLEHGPK